LSVSPLFSYVAELQGDRPWGAMLDAGTGRGSLSWVTSLATDRWTAVTGSRLMAGQVEEVVAGSRRPEDRIVIGNWTDPELLQGETYDTVLADYLLGAVEGFAPYAQYQLFDRLRPLVGRRLYVIGLEPYVPYNPSTPAGRLICEIGRLRDACLLIANERPYREYPFDWVKAHLEKAGFRIVASRHFPIRFRARFVNAQLDMCLDRITRFSDQALGRAMRSHVEDLRRRALAFEAENNGLQHGADYVIAAEPV
jgi:hypothetical protein